MYYYFLILIFIFSSCQTKIYSEEKLAIDNSYLKLFNAISKKDTITFQDSLKNIRRYIIISRDSIISNQRGLFINEKPYKLLRIKFIGILNLNSNSASTGEVFVSKDPERNLNSLYIQFNNFQVFTHESLLNFVNHYKNITNKDSSTVYEFHTKILSNLNKPDDIESLYASPVSGIIAIVTKSGGLWKSN
jgi:hypothetical protein